MKVSMMIFIFCLFSVGIGATVYLAMNGHPFFAFLVLLTTASIRIKWS